MSEEETHNIHSPNRINNDDLPEKHLNKYSDPNNTNNIVPTTSDINFFTIIILLSCIILFYHKKIKAFLPLFRLYYK